MRVMTANKLGRKFPLKEFAEKRKRQGYGEKAIVSGFGTVCLQLGKIDDSWIAG
jgi:hypothetical protein